MGLLLLSGVCFAQQPQGQRPMIPQQPAQQPLDLTVQITEPGFQVFQFPKNQIPRIDGDFYQTENEYLILVYHRPQGARYDALVGFAKVKSNGTH